MKSSLLWKILNWEHTGCSGAASGLTHCRHQPPGGLRTAHDFPIGSILFPRDLCPLSQHKARYSSHGNASGEQELGLRADCVAFLWREGSALSVFLVFPPLKSSEERFIPGPHWRRIHSCWRVGELGSRGPFLSSFPFSLLLMLGCESSCSSWHQSFHWGDRGGDSFWHLEGTNHFYSPTKGKKIGFFFCCCTNCLSSGHFLHLQGNFLISCLFRRASVVLSFCPCRGIVAAVRTEKRSERHLRVETHRRTVGLLLACFSASWVLGPAQECVKCR